MNNLKHVLKIIIEENRVSYWMVILHILVALICIPLILIDERVLMGVSVWIKPFKFLISIAIYIGTVSCLMRIYPYSQKKKNVINGILGWSLTLEMSIIFIQAFRGVQSHYNTSSQINGIMFGVMGLLIGINVLIMILFIIDTFRLKLKTSKAVQLSILYGWIIAFFGSWVGGQMITQLSHNVGIPDGGAGLPIINWSTTAGDLRVAHFLGIHGIQILPLATICLTKVWYTSNRNQIIAVCLFALSYAYWIALTFYQAKQGMPFIAI